MPSLPPIYVINLKRNPERRLHIQRQLDMRGLEGEFVYVDHIDKYELQSKASRILIAQELGIDESLIESKYAAIIGHAETKQDEKWKDYNLGQLVITLSHIKIYDLIVKNGIDWACILEDDATLLPTFPEVLKVASKLEWDILLLTTKPSNFSLFEYFRPRNSTSKYLVWEIIKYLLSFNRQINNSNKSKQRAYLVKCISEVYGIDPNLSPRQPERIAQILEEYEIEYKETIKRITLNMCYPPWHRFIHSLIRFNKLHKKLLAYTSTKFGSLPLKSSLESITEHHCIAKPHYPHDPPQSAAAYLVNRSAAMKWKRAALTPNFASIDQLYCMLYKNGQVKLRIVTPCCATVTCNYLLYSSRHGSIT